ncbi:MAG TPA: hypothetical protein PLP23_10880 [Panacibacter sp.]|nr:hypothetical protein [Panacibacter sp.]
MPVKVNKPALCPTELPTAQVSDTTGDDSSNAANYPNGFLIP